MKQGKVDWVTAVIGLILLSVGLLLLKAFNNLQGFMLVLPYVCIGVGCGAFGHGVGNLISSKAIKNSPNLQKQIEIDKNDERNISIANRAKAKAYDVMTYVFGALLLCFALMSVDVIAILLLVFVYLFVQGCGLYYHYKYNKEM